MYILLFVSFWDEIYDSYISPQITFMFIAYINNTFE